MNVYYLLLPPLFIVLLLIFWNIEARYYIESPSVKFLENRYLKLGLYPGDAEAVFLFSSDDISGETPEEDLIKIESVLEKHNVKGTFFTIPFFKWKESPVLGKNIESITSHGHEVAQHGYSHTRGKYKRIPYLGTFEFRNLSYSEQLERVKNGKKLLEANNIKIQGFRTPNFSSNTDTLDILITEGFSYVSDVRIRPEGKITNKRFLGIIYGSIYYPYFWETRQGRTLIITTNGDYTWDLGRVFSKSDLFLAKKRFNRYYEKNGVFSLLTHLHPMGTARERGIKFLDSFLGYISGEDVWKPTMQEFTTWWKNRCDLEVETTDGASFEIKLKLPESSEGLRGLRADIKTNKEFRIKYRDRVIKKGKGEKTVYFDLKN